MVNEGDLAPDFELRSDAGEIVRLSDLRGKPVVLYFYPKDDTPGCTTQACGIRDSWGDIERAGVVVLGVSPQDEKSHTKFKQKYGLPFPLLADTEHKVAELYGAWGEKRNYGRIYPGVIRSSFLIDSSGHVARLWRKVKAGEHTDWVLANLPN